ncbi:MAG: HD-GYP domain-containing protein [Firmicutes bacterium HGW-Firmicutes-14]|nr:MAG: HD-GYP domain-containing protein [Firmicutes bacterium HGW-Firmicutes-14]
MRIMSIQNVQPGMVLGKTVFGSSSKLQLLNAGTALTEEYIARLNELDVTSLYIVDENIGEVDIEDVVCDQTRLEAGKLAKDIMEKTRLGSSFDPCRVKNIINSIIDDLLSNKELLVKLVDIRTMSDYSYFHSVNVAILSGITGIGLGYSSSRLQELMIGALFHDLGKTLICDQMSCMHFLPEDETPAELKKHPELGFEVLRQNKSVSILSAHIALQHHEMYDGEGYPRKMTGSDIHEYARIVAIANIYDLLTTDRPEHPRMPSHQAVEYLLLHAGTFFDPDMIAAFVEGVALYPEGTIIKLNTGQTGVIIKSYRDFPTRPRVRILADRNGIRLPIPEVLELYNRPEYFISEVLDEIDK